MMVFLPPAMIRERDNIVPIWLKAILEEAEDDEAAAETMAHDPDAGDEYEALEPAVLDLIRLDRCEHRAWSRQKRAIRELTTIKLGLRFAPIGAGSRA
jgi:hypothetical protein